jgi:prophage DNA circulation protein
MGFKFSSIGAAFSKIASDIVTGAHAMETVLSKVQASAPTLEAVTSVISPQAALIETAAFGLLGKVASAVNGVEPAVAAKGINLQLDESEVADLQEIVSYLKTHPFSTAAVK